MSLVSADVVAFESAARSRISDLLERDLDVAVLSSLFAELETSSLPANEVSRRAGRIAQRLPERAGAPLAAVAAQSAPPVRAALIPLLPPSLQRSAYGGAAPPPTPVMPAPPAAEPSPDEGAEDEDRDLAAASEEREAEDWHTVLLLGGAREASANAQLLENRGIKPVRVAGRKELDDLAGERICGLVIYGGWWRQFATPEELVAFVGDQITHSNLLYLKLDYSHLEEATEPLSALLEDLDDEVRVRVNAAQGAGLTEADLKGFSAVAGLLGRAERVGVGVEGIDEADRRMLAAALASFAKRRHLTRFQGEEHLSIRPIFEGRSGARVLAVRSTAYRAVVVAKLDGLAQLQTELHRARRAIPAGWLSAGEMCLCSLNGRGVLLQRLLADLDQPSEGAPSLRERLRRCAAWEHGREGLPEPRAEDLRLGVDRLVEKVVLLNRAVADEPASEGWMDAETLRKLATLGVCWRIGEDAEMFDPAEHLERAKEILDGHDAKRVIHGDLHTGNLLMPDDRTPDLIDFALAGGGHPCFDLVRISSAIAYEFLRVLAGEPELRRFFARLHLDGAAEEELLEEFPDLLSGTGAGVAVHALTACRDAALRALDGEAEEKRSQYVAMVYLIAAQSLTIEGFQEAVVRSALAAVGPMIAADS